MLNKDAHTHVHVHMAPPDKCSTQLIQMILENESKIQFYFAVKDILIVTGATQT